MLHEKPLRVWEASLRDGRVLNVVARSESEAWAKLRERGVDPERDLLQWEALGAALDFAA